jgi:hypothetical protein
LSNSEQNLLLEMVGQLVQFHFRFFARSHLQLEVIDGFNGLMGRGRKAAHAFEQSEVLTVELAMLIVGDRPNRTYRLPLTKNGTSNPSSASGRSSSTT